MKCYLNIPVLGRSQESVSESVNKMTAIAKAKWGEDIEIFVYEYADFEEPYPVDKEPTLEYLTSLLYILADCDCMITTFDTMFCKDDSILRLIGQAASLKQMNIIAVHCIDWFHDSVQNMDNVDVSRR